MKKISVIIPMFNSEKTIHKCMTSILEQTYDGVMEVIVVNDGSTDNSKEIVENFILNNKTQISFNLINKSNGGVSSARNVGLMASSGFWIALLDSDDRWLPNKIENQMQILNENLDIDFLGCSRNNETLKIFGKKINNLHKVNVKELLIKMYPQTSTAIFKKSLFELYGGYNEKMTHAEDGELWVRYCANSNFYYSPQSLVVTGEGKPSFGYSGLSANLQKMHRGNMYILEQALKNKLINVWSFLLFWFYYQIKHLRRIILTKNYGL
ncbi:glycosyltransferase involved in cell wall biosynthesis [Flavobacterium sp. 90]|uniref:glycosyltransferase family 2 protein n=1 Tax=unclassified Flavobacterium TaxID=196869 RepID=UPI000EB37A0A|nr:MULTISPECIES: glycosyltransferase family A protein [unclassified Flavobacterium]RKR10919.1 glycosyltransferase involved in cell wall biosynthesis [Flavobacterium sp. 81]TCK54703.1 glycosyltransferase involved in cell wall biosynthesis [Flavobacterium sp. 90]